MQKSKVGLTDTETDQPCDWNSADQKSRTIGGQFFGNRNNKKRDESDTKRWHLAKLNSLLFQALVCFLVLMGIEMRLRRARYEKSRKCCQSKAKVNQVRSGISFGGKSEENLAN